MKDVVTAIDILNEQTKLEQDAKESLPGKFEKCTFALGYVRQPLFACETCSTMENSKKDGERVTTDDTAKQSIEPAGMCYSCSMACHADHDLYELFPKRHFRCDCGVNDKFGKHQCQLSVPEKCHATNDENKYNHNFKGRYCRCNQLYNPSEEEETMYQCAICEDWFHERCIGNIPDSIGEFESYICRDCVKDHPYIAIQDPKCSIGICRPGQPIHRWVGLAAAAEETNTTTVDNITIDHAPPQPVTTATTATITTTATDKRKLDDCHDDTVESSSKKAKLEDKDGAVCKRVHDILKDDDELMELFLEEGWREKLCRCKQCGPRYEMDKIDFVLREEVTYEPEEDEDAGKSLMQIGMEQLSKMNRVEALDGLRMYQTLWDQIKPFLQTFQESGQVVTASDIQSFFDQRRREREEEKGRSA